MPYLDRLDRISATAAHRPAASGPRMILLTLAETVVCLLAQINIIVMVCYFTLPPSRGACVHGASVRSHISKKPPAQISLLFLHCTYGRDSVLLSRQRNIYMYVLHLT